jgi:hypothetical protein
VKLHAWAASIAALCLAGAARPDASVAYTFSNFTDWQIVTIDGSAPPRPVDGQTLRAGELVERWFDYTITLRDDGLPNAVIPWGDFYGPGAIGDPHAVGWIYAGVRPGDETYISLYGSETAFMQIYVQGCVSSRTCGGFMEEGQNPVMFMTPQDLSPDVITVSGSFRLYWGIAANPNDTTDYYIRYPGFAVRAVAFSVPEPGTYALMLGGLALLVSIRRRLR